MGGSSKTPKSRALGRALAEARNDAGMNQRDVAGKIERGTGTVARWETGERMPSAEDLANFLDVCRVTGERRTAIEDMARGSNDRRWLAFSLPEQRAQLSALVDLEANAKRIVTASPLLIPGLLQTQEYVRGIMSAGKIPPDEIGTRVAARMGRRDVITRREPADLVALIGEAALRWIVGSKAVMIRQLRYLLEMADYANIDIRVVPFSSGWTPLLEGPFSIVEPAGGGSVTTVNLENRISAIMLDEEVYVRAYQEAVDRILEVAMSPDASSELIAEVITDLE